MSNLRPPTTLTKHAIILEQEFDWLNRCIQLCINQFLNPQDTIAEVISAPVLEADWQSVSPYVALINKYKLGVNERKTLLLALLPELKPEVLDVFLIKNGHLDRPFSEFGGYYDEGFSGFLPNLRTALFILAGSSVAAQFEVAALFDSESPLFKYRILENNGDANTLPLYQQKLRLTETTRSYLLTGNENLPLNSLNFPAKELHSTLSWSQLVLPDNTLIQLKELMAWLDLDEQADQQSLLRQTVSCGYRCLFYGPSGTGKTLTAALLGKRYQRPVYRVDLSQLVSKYIGETEKNLEKVFVAAEERNWILFFDEADALFGHRTGVSNANDKHSNEQVAYLLQRLESCSAVIILATNLRENLDKAFIRRFQSMINFSRPLAKQRAQLWINLFGEHWPLDRNIDFEQLGEQYDLSGGAMNNVIRYCTLMALTRRESIITLDNLTEGIHREYTKESRTP